MSFDSSLTARAGCGDGLAIDRVGTVASNEDAWDFSFWGAFDLFQIANLIHVQPILKDLCVGLVSDGEEETIDSDIYHLLIGFSLAFYEVGAFYAILAVKTNCVVLKEDFSRSLTRCCITCEARRKGLRTMR